MYVSSESWLYPGDIIKALELPNLKGDSYRLTPHPESEAKPFCVRQMMDNELFAYISHECDFNDNKRQFFIITPLIGIDVGLRREPQGFKRLIDSNDIENYPFYLNLFYYSAHNQILPKDMVIDFTRVISVPVKNKSSLVEKKILQLDPSHRNFLKKKISYYYLHEQ